MIFAVGCQRCEIFCKAISDAFKVSGDGVLMLNALYGNVSCVLLAMAAILYSKTEAQTEPRRVQGDFRHNYRTENDVRDCRVSETMTAANGVQFGHSKARVVSGIIVSALKHSRHFCDQLVPCASVRRRLIYHFKAFADIIQIRFEMILKIA